MSATSAQPAIHTTVSWDCGRDKPSAVITAMTVLTPGQQKPVSIYNLNSHPYTTTSYAYGSLVERGFVMAIASTPFGVDCAGDL